ncbi:hypothetical protein JHK82_029456 [Glycine max]|nr:hypothetical protein GLYMA_10G281300v4 [Glycine max]KAG4998659.1 hypothetical protein JHK85_030098 [Glycine max]KAG5005434.1 hypothetical protein JHK86_029573 [Glycine max]KAG5128621.1 hypothetical protein JHK82_029456 [Glycine max]KAG5153228.1 hypothetical protein JHK84_029700 [Glycine max]
MSSHGRNIHFFKRIEEDTIRKGELRIPRSFVNKYWEGISNPVLLLLPKGAEWNVKWKKLDADIWLIDEWKKFAEFCSLDQEHLLVFKYVGKSRFQVVTFDQNGLEMQYPLMSETLLDGNSICQRKRAKSPFSHSPSIKKVKTNPRKEPANYPSHDVKTEPAQSQRANVELSKNFHADDLVKAKPKKRGGRRRIMCSKSKAIQNTESSTALERANSFRSENPFFICAMRKTYIQRSVLFMPGNFITEDQQREDDHVFLWISSERAWHVKFYPSHSSGQILLSIGWMDFVKDNNLKIGDVCVFDQIKKPGISFRVVIFRDTEESSPSKFPAYDKDGANGSKQTGLQNVIAKRGSDGIPKKYSENNNFDDSEFRRCNNEVSENDFTLSISKPCQFYCMYVPKKFIRSHEMDHINEVKLQVGKRSWNVKLDCYGRFTSGLHDFLSQCNVEAGDVCHFELIDKKKFVFEVRVTRCISID